LSIAPWLSSTAQQPRSELRQDASISLPEAGSLGQPQDDDVGTGGLSDQLRGSMSLEQIASLAGVSVDYLVEQLGLPNTVLADARVGQLLREQGLHMSDLRRVVDQAVGPSREPKQDREAVQ